MANTIRVWDLPTRLFHWALVVCIVGSVATAQLGSLLLQVATGLISDDEITTVGPMSQSASNATVRVATYYHTPVDRLIPLALILLHIGAIAFYFFRKQEDLVRPMIHGDRETTAQFQGSRDDAGSRAMAAANCVGCGSLVYWLVNL